MTDFYQDFDDVYFLGLDNGLKALGRVVFEMSEKRKVVIPRTVWVLGFVSLLMDISSEMIHALLPLFMAGTLGASAIWIGLVEGVGEGAALVTKVFSGLIADRFGHKKWLVFLGYFLGVVSKPVFALAGSVPVVLGARLFDRIGKGMRGAPRDAIVADVTDESIRGAAYGLRQSLDAAGAFVGPLCATLLLLVWTQDLRWIFWVALIPGLACLMLILLGVEDRVSDSRNAKRITWEQVLDVMSTAFKSLIILGVLFSLARFSNAFIVLRAADVGIEQTWIPMVMVLMNVAFSFSSYPFGKLADRLNPMKLLSIGLLLLIASDLIFAFSHTAATLLLAVVCFGLHLGATQGIFSTIVSQVAPSHLRATAFGVFNFFSGLALLVSGIVAGSLWEVFGAQYCFLGGVAFSLLTLLSIRACKIL